MLDQTGIDAIKTWIKTAYPVFKAPLPQINPNTGEYISLSQERQDLQTAEQAVIDAMLESHIIMTDQRLENAYPDKYTDKTAVASDNTFIENIFIMYRQYSVAYAVFMSESKYTEMVNTARSVTSVSNPNAGSVSYNTSGKIKDIITELTTTLLAYARKLGFDSRPRMTYIAKPLI